MTPLRSLPIRSRLTLVFTCVMAVLFGVIAFGIYLNMSYALLDEIDSGLLSRAQTIRGQLSKGDLRLIASQEGLIESAEQFAQVVDRNDRVIQSDHPAVGPILPRDVVRSVKGTTLIERRVPGIPNVARIVAAPGQDPTRVIVVGATMQDRDEALRLLTLLLAAGGPIALAIASFAGWWLSGSALRPVERMRQQASAISASGLDRRLSVPEANDEFRRLAETLNSMLGRLDESIQSERRFLDNASHELRTPLAVLKTELDLALSRPRSPEELAAALRSVAEETDRLATMAEDLLVLARTQHSRFPVNRAEVSLGALVSASCQFFATRAEAAGVRISEDAPDAAVLVDAARVRQAVDNLIDNALRVTPAGGSVSVRGEVRNGTVRIMVDDTGPGFPPGFERDAFEPFRHAAATADPHDDRDGTGLGLAIVKAIAQSHGGSVTAENRPEGGARVTLSLSSASTGEGPAEGPAES